MPKHKLMVRNGCKFFIREISAQTSGEYDPTTTPNILMKDRKISKNVAQNVSDGYSNAMNSYKFGETSINNSNQTPEIKAQANQNLRISMMKRLKSLSYGCKNQKCVDGYYNKIQKVLSGEAFENMNWYSPEETQQQKLPKQVFEQTEVPDHRYSYEIPKKENLKHETAVGFNPKQMAKEYCDKYLGSRKDLSRSEYRMIKNGYSNWIKNYAKLNEVSIKVTPLKSYLDMEIKSRGINIHKDKDFFRGKK